MTVANRYSPDRDPVTAAVIAKLFITRFYRPEIFNIEAKIFKCFSPIAFQSSILKGNILKRLTSEIVNAVE